MTRATMTANLIANYPQYRGQGKVRTLHTASVHVKSVDGMRLGEGFVAAT